MRFFKSFSYKEYVVFVVSSIILFVSLLFTSVPAFSSNYYLSISFKVLFLSLTGASTVLICFLNKTNVSFVALFIEFIYLITGIISLSINSMSFKEWIWNFGILGEIIILINLSFLSRRVFNRKLVYLLTIFLSLIVFIACLYSNIVEANDIYNSIIAKGEESHFFQIKSFFDSRNSYGFIIFVSISLLSLLSCKANKLRPFLLPLIFYYLINLIFSRCKIAIFATTIVLLTLLVIFLMKLWSKRRVQFFVVIICVFLLTSLFICSVFIPQIYNNFGFLKNLNNYISEGFFGQAIRSMQSRIKQFESISPLFSSPRLLIGYGENSKSISIDNAYASLLLTGGLPKALLFVFASFYSFEKIFSLYKFDKCDGSLLISIYICSFLYGVFEGFSTLGTSFFSLSRLILLFLVPSAFLVEEKSLRAKQSNHVLHVVGSFNKGGTEAFILNYFREIKKHSKVIFDIYCFGNSDLEQVNKLCELGGNIYYGCAPSTKKMLAALISFKSFLKKNPKYKAIHCSSNFDNFIYLHIANLLDVPCRIQHSHDTLTGITMSKIKRLVFFFKRIFNNYNSNKSFACSNEAGYDVIGKKYFSTHGKVIPNCVDVDRFSMVNEKRVITLKREFNLENKKVFGNISRFEDKKNQKFILDIFDKYHKGENNSVLVLGGVDGGTLKSIKEYASRLASSNSIIFIGPRNDVEDWLHIIDVYLMPSLFEGFGISAIEAQIAGSYVIASDRLPPITDIGLNRICYLSLDNDVSFWIKKMKNEKHKDDLKILNLYYDVKISYKILLEEYN